MRTSKRIRAWSTAREALSERFSACASIFYRYGFFNISIYELRSEFWVCLATPGSVEVTYWTRRSL